jgi:predicted ABC-class ATPase
MPRRYIKHGTEVVMRRSGNDTGWKPILSGSDSSRWFDNRDPVIKMMEHNQRVQAQSRQRLERIHEERKQRQTELQIIQESKSETICPDMFRVFLNKLRMAQCDFKILHFTMQFGRLKIELSRAKGSHTNGDEYR